MKLKMSKEFIKELEHLTDSQLSDSLNETLDCLALIEGVLDKSPFRSDKENEIYGLVQSCKQQLESRYGCDKQ
jgi:hypothetical protein